MDINHSSAFQSLFPGCDVTHIWLGSLYELAGEQGIPEDEFGYVFLEGEVYLMDIRAVPKALVLATLKEIGEKAYVLHRHEPPDLLVVSFGVEKEELYWTISAVSPEARNNAEKSVSADDEVVPEEGYTTRKRPHILAS